MEAWIILGVVIVLLVAFAAFALIKATKQRYPDGSKHTKKWSKYRINVIVGSRAEVGQRGPLFIDAATKAVIAVITAHKNMKSEYPQVSGDSELLKEFNVYLTTEELMIPNAAAYIQKYDGLPTAVVSDAYVDEVIATGEPVIHEACHALLDDYIGNADDHEDETVWKAFGENTVQGEANKVYKGLKKV